MSDELALVAENKDVSSLRRAYQNFVTSFNQWGFTDDKIGVGKSLHETGSDLLEKLELHPPFKYEASLVKPFLETIREYIERNGVNSYGRMPARI